MEINGLIARSNQSFICGLDKMAAGWLLWATRQPFFSSEAGPVHEALSF